MGTVPRLAGRRMDATEFPVDISLSTLETDGGTLIIAFVRDLSQRERAMEEVRSQGSTVHVDDPSVRMMIDLAGAEGGERTATKGSAATP